MRALLRARQGRPDKRPDELAELEERGSGRAILDYCRVATEICTEVERAWRDLKRHHLAHRTFKSTDELACVIHTAVRCLNKERMMIHPYDKLDKAA